MLNPPQEGQKLGSLLPINLLLTPTFPSPPPKVSQRPFSRYHILPPSTNTPSLPTPPYTTSSIYFPHLLKLTNFISNLLRRTNTQFYSYWNQQQIQIVFLCYWIKKIEPLSELCSDKGHHFEMEKNIETGICLIYFDKLAISMQKSTQSVNYV